MYAPLLIRPSSIVENPSCKCAGGGGGWRMGPDRSSGQSPGYLGGVEGGHRFMAACHII